MVLRCPPIVHRRTRRKVSTVLGDAGMLAGTAGAMALRMGMMSYGRYGGYGFWAMVATDIAVTRIPPRLWRIGCL